MTVHVMPVYWSLAGIPEREICRSILSSFPSLEGTRYPCPSCGQMQDAQMYDGEIRDCESI